MYITNSRARKSIPLKQYSLFNKAKHSEEWHRAIDAIAGVLHPTDPKFPYHLLQQATDAYIKRKGKIAQADVDTRLAILLESHEAKDIAVAAVAYAMTAGSLRAALRVDLNVAHGSYWGLNMWLQCIIAANHENSASATDLEAIWAQHLLPFATHGPGAAGKILIGVSRALREMPTPNMNLVPDFLTLTSRALTDYGAYLEGLRLKNNWTAAYGASYWMAELGRTCPGSKPLGYLLPEHILDTKFPIWRAWASWRPNLGLTQTLSSVDGNNATLLSDLLALEGPDFISGTGDTLMKGLVEQYESDRTFVKFGGLLVEVCSRTKGGLMEILENAVSILGFILTTVKPTDRPHLLGFFIKIAISRLMTQEALNLVQAVLFMSAEVKSSLGLNLLDSVLQIYIKRNDLDGSHIIELQDIIQLFDRDGSSNIRKILLTPSLLKGIARCIEDGQTAVSTLMEQGHPWTELVLELHKFCTVLKQSKSVPIVGEQTIEKICLLLPSAEHVTIAIEVYTTARDRRRQSLRHYVDTHSSTSSGRNADDEPRPIASPSLSTGRSDDPLYSLKQAVEQYISHRILLQQPPSYISQRTFEPILRVWEGTFAPELTQNRRSLVILVAEFTDNDADLRIRCLNAIASTDQQLGSGLSVQDLLTILRGMESNPAMSVIKFIQLVARCPVVRDWKADIICWRDLIHHLLMQEGRSGVCEGMKLLDYALSNMNSSEWLSFLADAQLVFMSGPSLSLEEEVVPPILRSDLHRYWAELTPFTKTLTRLETAIGENSDAMRRILGHCGAQSNNILLVLQILKDVEHEPIESFLHLIVSSLSSKTENAREVSQCISVVSDASPETVEICKKIWDAKHGYLMMPRLPHRSQQPFSGGDDWLKTVTVLEPGVTKSAAIPMRKMAPANQFASRYEVPSSVVEVMVIGWLLDESASEDTKLAVRAIACLLVIAQTGLDLTKDKLMEAAAFWQKLEDELIQEASRLEALQKALKKKDPHGTSLLLQQIGVPDTTELDEEISKLPTEAMNAVERIGDSEIEITFSLAAFTQLKRAAMGIPDGANTLSLQLSLDCNKKSPPAFCLHYNTEQSLETGAHTRYSCSEDSGNPTSQICTSAQTAFTWQLSRIIYSKLRRGETGILDMYQHVSASLPDLTQYCVSCSTIHESETSQLRRSIPCDLNLYSCAELWYALPLHVRIPEIRTDIFAVDIALSSVYTAAVTHKSELLQGCPIRTFSSVRAIINSLPTVHVMRDAVNLSAVLCSYHSDAEKLISWVVVQHRGFLATATGLLKIPNLPPGTHQFVFANAKSKLESGFARRLQATKRDTTILFHGTSLDRLPAILTQGLRIYSGTALQRTGAAHGKGIYLSEDPATSFYYSTASLSWKNSGLNMMRMLLGCELVGTANKVIGNVHVVADPESVMVRYVLLFPRDARMPIRGHVEPAMASGMKALRSGAA
ncbi:ubiquitin conjugating polymerase [Stagonosporopsis vannaccii]|nr:ubiquitin conjugating polymerase [Stagonosporopsis vannaccii]